VGRASKAILHLGIWSLQVGETWQLGKTMVKDQVADSAVYVLERKQERNKSKTTPLYKLIHQRT
jgi:hypothetical protein